MYRPGFFPYSSSPLSSHLACASGSIDLSTAPAEYQARDNPPGFILPRVRLFTIPSYTRGAFRLIAMILPGPLNEQPQLR